MSILAKRLKKARDEAGLKQIDAAEKLGISNGTLSGYERDYRDPDTDVLNKMAELYGVTVDYLLGRSDDPKVNRSDKNVVKGNEIIDFLNDGEVTYKGSSLSKEDKERVIEMLKIMLKKDTD